MDIERLRRIEASAGELVADTSANATARRLASMLCDLAGAMLAEHDSLTTAQACERLDLSPVAVRQLVRRGRLTARHEGRELRITRESIAAFAADRRPRKKFRK